VRCLLSIFARFFATLYDGDFIVLLTGRIGMLGLYNFSYAFSVGGEDFFWIRYFIFRLFMINLHCCNVFCISFWYLSVGSLESGRKLLVSINVCTFLEYSSEFMVTTVLPLSA
jgi:hypothetical protein